jgi:hypothetical protein
MSNRRKLRPFRAHTITRPGHISSAYPGETCTYHPDCCEVDDFTCPGCGNTAIGAVTWQTSDGERRNPFCQEHEAAMGFMTEAMAQHTTSEAN